MAQILCKSAWQFLQKWNMRLAYHPLFKFLGIYAREKKACVLTNTCMWMLKTTLFVNPPKFQSPVYAYLLLVTLSITDIGVTGSDWNVIKVPIQVTLRLFRWAWPNHMNMSLNMDFRTREVRGWKYMRIWHPADVYKVSRISINADSHAPCTQKQEKWKHQRRFTTWGKTKFPLMRVWVCVCMHV